jgi:hypothetical protein
MYDYVSDQILQPWILWNAGSDCLPSLRGSLLGDLPDSTPFVVMQIDGCPPEASPCGSASSREGESLHRVSCHNTCIYISLASHERLHENKKKDELGYIDAFPWVLLSTWNSSVIHCIYIFARARARVCVCVCICIYVCVFVGLRIDICS